ncbi:hypothetical protein V3331_01875 [Gaopeijia maritima]|uniref:AbiJ-NTD4 domain-containing protein n=1 Tax=Gaopeijia maritima TaxID=3119007 RepID=UPI0032478751
MARFSERIGVVKPRDAMQVDSLDRRSRVRLLNALMAKIPSVNNSHDARSFWEVFWTEFLHEPIDDLPGWDHEIRSKVSDVFLFEEWWWSLDAIDFLVQMRLGPPGLEKEVAAILREEMIGFRFIDGALRPVTEEEQVVAIEEALQRGKDRFSGAGIHLRQALSLLSSRTTPDYRNSVKESVSAVEAVAQVVTGDPKASLGEAMNRLEAAGVPTHSAFREGVKKLYGYSSDGDGIRHALSDESQIGQAEAKYMLVICSAFCSYLIEKFSDSRQL